MPELRARLFAAYKSGSRARRACIGFESATELFPRGLTAIALLRSE
jgi:hypothetical protein